MADLPIFHTTRDDKLYGVIGRALALATSFELNCKALEALMAMKKGLLLRDKQAIEDSCEKIEKKWLKPRFTP